MWHNNRKGAYCSKFAAIQGSTVKSGEQWRSTVDSWTVRACDRRLWEQFYFYQLFLLKLWGAGNMCRYLAWDLRWTVEKHGGQLDSACVWQNASRATFSLATKCVPGWRAAKVKVGFCVFFVSRDLSKSVWAATGGIRNCKNVWLSNPSTPLSYRLFCSPANTSTTTMGGLPGGLGWIWGWAWVVLLRGRCRDWGKRGGIKWRWSKLDDKSQVKRYDLEHELVICLCWFQPTC